MFSGLKLALRSLISTYESQTKHEVGSEIGSCREEVGGRRAASTGAGTLLRVAGQCLFDEGNAVVRRALQHGGKKVLLQRKCSTFQTFISIPRQAYHIYLEAGLSVCPEASLYQSGRRANLGNDGKVLKGDDLEEGWNG